MKIGISSCLIGKKVRYDGTHKRNDELLNLLSEHELIDICPEIEASFTVPRKAIEIKNGKVVTIDDTDLTKQLIQGSLKCFEMIKDCDFVILKSKSPSCGYKFIYDGTYSNTLTTGNGIFTEICLKNNIEVFSENDIDNIKLHLIK